MAIHKQNLHYSRIRIHKGIDIQVESRFSRHFPMRVTGVPDKLAPYRARQPASPVGMAILGSEEGRRNSETVGKDWDGEERMGIKTGGSANPVRKLLSFELR